MNTGKRKAGEPKLMSAGDAAAALGVTRTNLYTVSGLPEAYDETMSGKLWRAQEIKALAARRNARRAEEAEAAA